MKKLAILLLAFTLLCTCFVLAACGDDGETSSAAESSSNAGTSSSANTSSTATSSTDNTSTEASTSAPADESSAVSDETSTEAPSDDPSDDPSEDPSGDPSDDPTDDPVAAEGELFWLTHYNTLSNEGSGVILSEPYENGNWWFHASFKPVEGEDGVYEIVEVLDGSSDGNGHPLDIPEGGFVYALHTGNNYEGGIDYTTQTGATMLDAARKWKAGEKFTFTGVDFENFTEVPTTTPGINWYEDGDNGTGNYVCTATYKKVG